MVKDREILFPNQNGKKEAGRERDRGKDLGFAGAPIKSDRISLPPTKRGARF